MRIIAKAATREAAAALALPVSQEIAARLGPAVWGTDDETPASRVIALLSGQKRTVGIADGVTGGAIASLIAAERGHGPILAGAIATAPDAGLPGIPGWKASSDDGKALAIGAANEALTRMAADVGLAAVRAGDAGVVFGAASARGSYATAESRRWPREIAMQRAAVMASIGLGNALDRGAV